MSLVGKLNIVYARLIEVDRATSIPHEPMWSETMAVTGTVQVTANAAVTFGQEQTGRFGTPIFLVQAGVDAFVAIGPEPDAVAGPRYAVRAGEDRIFPVSFGDHLAVVAA